MRCEKRPAVRIISVEEKRGVVITETGVVFTGKPKRR